MIANDSSVRDTLTETLGSWLFLPRLKAGEPVATDVQVPLQFCDPGSRSPIDFRSMKHLSFLFGFCSFAPAAPRGRALSVDADGEIQGATAARGPRSTTRIP